jgi:hypothetical protein
VAAAPINGLLDNGLDAERPGEDLREGGTWLLDLVAAVDYLGRGFRCGLTVWDAIEEALRWADPGDDSGRDGDVDVADALRAAIEHLLDAGDLEVGGVAASLQKAIRRWASCMADRYNNGHTWPHPVPRRVFPAPLLVETENAP